MNSTGKTDFDATETTSQCSTETSSQSSNETLENENLNDTLEALETYTVDINCQTQENLFNGKHSLFNDGVDIDNPLPRTRSSAFSRKPVKSLNSLVSLEDSMSGGLLDSSTQVWSFGKNSYGQLGLGDIEDRYVF